MKVCGIFLVASFDGANFYIYLDGHSFANKSVPLAFSSNTSSIPLNVNLTQNYVGKSNCGGGGGGTNDGESFSFIYDLRIYNKSLTQEEIIELCNDASVCQIKMTTLQSQSESSEKGRYIHVFLNWIFNEITHGI
jgi:hypothetical protein